MNSFPLLPAPAMLLDHLLGLVFIVHVIFMNFVAAAPFVVAWYLLVKGERGRQRARWLVSVMPVAFTLAINFGVACLLFVQALFSQRFFTANVILGSTWLAVIGLLLAAFYGTYIAKRQTESDRLSPRIGGVMALVVGGLVWSIGLIMICNYFISTSSSDWMMLRDHPSAVLSNLTFIPRALHFLIGSFAVTGFWMIGIAWWKQRRGNDQVDVAKFRQQGIALATAATAIQIVIGIWYVLWLPQETWDRLLSGSFVSIVWMSGVAAGLLMLACLVIANFSPRSELWVKSATGLMIFTLFGMASGRDLVRLTAFGADFHLREIPAQPQIAATRLFLILLVLGVATIIYLLRLIWRTPRGQTK
jgi:hypothetical protein